MNPDSATESLQAILKKCDVLIGYAPLPDEPDFFKAPVLSHFHASLYRIPADKTNDPFEYAEELVQRFANSHPCLVIPGQKFDAQGSRHGRGGGWYDRLLCKLSREWVRIGVCFAQQYSVSRLPREQWDESMDYLLLYTEEKDEWEIKSAEPI